MLLLLAVVASAAAALPARAQAPATEARDLKGRAEFAAGRYHEAVEIYASLYAETLHPTYLRNIGRCYQNLGEPDRAIASFRDYQRKAKDLTAEQRTEVEGFIKEMQDLKAQRAAASDKAAAPPAVARDRGEAAPGPWRTTGLVIAGAGAVGVAVGVIYALGAKRSNDQALGLCTGGD